MNKKKGIVITASVLIAAGIIWNIAGRKDDTTEYETRPLVSTENPGTGDITLYTELTGTIEPQARASVMPKIGGEVLNVNFQAGDSVEEGQVLCTIDSDALQTLKLQMEAAGVSASEAQREFQRLQPLYAGGYVSQQAYDQARDGAQNASIAYETAKTQYELQLKYTTVTAPISGVIESRNVDAHDHIGTSTVLCVISGSEQMEAKFGVTEKTRQNMHTGDEVTVSKNGVDYEGQVTEIGSMVNNATGLYDVQAVLGQPEGLSNGTRVKLTVIMDHVTNVMTVPVDAVNYDDGQAFVYVYDNETGSAVKTDFEPGIYDLENMQVVSGLKADDQVIVDWSNELVNGAQVRLKGDDEAEQATEEADPENVQEDSAKKAGE